MESKRISVSDKLRASRLPVKNQRVSVEPEPDLADKGEKAAYSLRVLSTVSQ